METASTLQAVWSICAMNDFVPTVYLIQYLKSSVLQHVDNDKHMYCLFPLIKLQLTPRHLLHYHAVWLHHTKQTTGRNRLMLIISNQIAGLPSTAHHHSVSCLATTSLGRKCPKQTHTYDIVIALLAWGTQPFIPITVQCEEAQPGVLSDRGNSNVLKGTKLFVLLSQSGC